MTRSKYSFLTEENFSQLRMRKKSQVVRELSIYLIPPGANRAAGLFDSLNENVILSGLHQIHPEIKTKSVF